MSISLVNCMQSKNLYNWKCYLSSFLPCNAEKAKNIELGDTKWCRIKIIVCQVLRVTIASFFQLGLLTFSVQFLHYFIIVFWMVKNKSFWRLGFILIRVCFANKGCYCCNKKKSFWLFENFTRTFLFFFGRMV